MTARQQLDSAMAHHRMGRLAEAERIYRDVLAQDSNQPDALHMLGVLSGQAGQLDAAVELIRRAIRIKPDSAIAQNNLGTALAKCGRIDEAIAALRQAIRLKPDYADAYYNLGSALRETEWLDEAIACLREAVRLKPDSAEAYNNLGSTLKWMGELDEAIAAFRQAIRLKPDFTDAHSNLIFALQFHSGYDAETILEELRRWNQRHAEPFGKFIQPHSNNREPGRRLRIGYISADFRIHSVSRFLLPMLGQHDHGAYEIICYSDVLKTDGMTDRLRACVDGWQNIVGWNDERVADKVRQDKIDILVDLAGHTAANRLRVFAQSPRRCRLAILVIREQRV